MSMELAVELAAFAVLPWMCVLWARVQSTLMMQMAGDEIDLEEEEEHHGTWVVHAVEESWPVV